MSRRTPMVDLALVAVFAALIAAVTVFVPGIPLPGGVPITLQTFAVAATAMVLGPVRGALATLLYVLVGLAGLPVFAQGASGLGVLSKASAGYLLSFPLYALVVGYLATRVVRRGLGRAVLGLVLAGLVGSFLVVHPAGVLGLMRNAGMSLGKAVGVDVAFWPGDLIKTVLAALVAVAVHRAFPALALGPVPRAAGQVPGSSPAHVSAHVSSHVSSQAPTHASSQATTRVAPGGASGPGEREPEHRTR